MVSALWHSIYNLHLKVIYDESGQPFALKYSDDGGKSFDTYYYVLNLQGDVVKLVWYIPGFEYETVATYTYDAWGNILSATGELAEINPLRYRGYYYDSETGFYYLQSRYYDPATRRFINADAYASTGQGFTGTNMFAYCLNNPAMHSDPEGMKVDEPVPLFTTWEGALGYITDQDATGLAEKLLINNWGLSATVSHGGCGPIATYNANIALGRQIPIDEVLCTYQEMHAYSLSGWLGMMPLEVCAYFKNAGYTVKITDDLSEIDEYSQVADACIMWYLFETNSFPWVGGHFVQYQRDGFGYAAHNVGPTGTIYFDLPSEFAYQGKRFYATGIFIFE